MLMTEIRREGIDEQATDVGPALVALAESARAVLGYAVLAKQVGTLAIKTETTLLRMTLQSLDLPILNEHDVARYQKERLIERTAELMQEWIKRTAEVGADSFHDNGLDSFSAGAWVRTKINEYKQPVPEFVLAKAVQIKEKMPECTIYVESLQDHPDPFLVVGAAKPEYSWRKPDEHYYLDVWAEPKFEGRLASGEARSEGIEDEIGF